MLISDSSIYFREQGFVVSVYAPSHEQPFVSLHTATIYVCVRVRMSFRIQISPSLVDCGFVFSFCLPCCF